MSVLDGPPARFTEANIQRLCAGARLRNALLVLDFNFIDIARAIARSNPCGGYGKKTGRTLDMYIQTRLGSPYAELEFCPMLSNQNVTVLLLFTA